MTYPTRVLICALLLSSSPLIPANAQGTADCQKRTVVVNVLDHQGNVVSGLGPTEFRAEFRGRPLKVLSDTATSLPRRVVILLDLSGSMSNVAEMARLLAENLAIAHPDRLQPALVLFSDKIIDSVDFSRPHEEVLHRVASVPANKGHTALLDALEYTSRLFQPPRSGDMVYLISDGGDNGSKAQRADVKREFLAKGVRIYSICLAVKYSPTEEERFGPELLKDLADLTGGIALDVDADSKSSRELLLTELPRLYRQMMDFYELQLELPKEPIRKRQQWYLEVVDGQGKKRKDLRLVYPHELAPCSSTVERTSSR